MKSKVSPEAKHVRPPGRHTAAAGRLLYFDIDGVLLTYEDAPKPALEGGELERRLKNLGFADLVCVSGWSDMLKMEPYPLPDEEQAAFIHELLGAVFPDEEWFLKRLVLTEDTDHRCRHIDLARDWYYVDDWADEYFTQQFGRELYGEELGRRILLVDPYGDGSDLLAWLDGIS